MPPICIHLSVARDAATQLHQPVVEQNMGRYLLGVTLPDIHLVSGDSRLDTHYFDLGTGSLRSSVNAFLASQSQLGSLMHMDGSQKMLVAGYLSHLVTDELWIIEIYRPFFGPASPLKGDAMANVMDRALQFELDRRVRLQRDKIDEITTLLKQQNWDEASSFADGPSLERWREFVFGLLSRPPSWDRFPAYARSFLLTREKVKVEQLEKFLSSLPEVLNNVLSLVPQQKIESFIKEAVSASAALTKEFIT